MKRTAIPTIIGAAVAMVAGVVLARVVPSSRSSNLANTNVSSSGAESAASAKQPETALARVIRTETGSKRWLVLLAQAEKADATKIPSLIRSAGEDSAMIRMLAARWAELDPEHMFA